VDEVQGLLGCQAEPPPLHPAEAALLMERHPIGPQDDR